MDNTDLHEIAEKTIAALRLRFFDAYHVDSGERALEKALSLIPQDHTVSWGGSVTLDKLNIYELLDKHGYKTINRDSARTPEERVQLQRNALLCDTFLCGTNAISQDGCLVNIDGNGNRVGALVYGPRQVIILASTKKIAPNVEAAIFRARNTAAPLNAQRLNMNTPCAANGECANCKGASSICAQVLVTRLCKPAGRIKIILIDEDLGM
ncbi:MAG: lactate utilization protein [Treponemataceae bacterium]|nr:MAG: lactate utilization protein [Treponemataceae bacterium]